ncbi:response regulator [bacterium]|nr:response regulator [bacterium]
MFRQTGFLGFVFLGLFGCSLGTPPTDVRIGLGEDGRCTPLEGPWNFFPFQWAEPTDSLQPTSLSVPLGTLWNDMPEMEREGVRSGYGYATYQLTLRIPAGMRNPAVLVPEVYTAHRLFADGVLIASNGRVGSDRTQSEAYWLPKIALLPPGKTECVLTFQVSNFEHFKGGVFDPLVLGPLQVLQLQRTREFAWVSLLSGGLLIGGLFFLGFFLFDRSDRTVLYFSLFCIFYAYRILGTDAYVLHEILPGLRFPLAVRLEYGSLYLAVMMFAAFLRNLYPHDLHPGIVRFYLFFNAFHLLCLFLPVYYFSGLLTYFLWGTAFFIGYALYVYIRAFVHSRVGSGWALFSGIFIGLSSMILLLDYLQYFSPDKSLYYSLYAAFFISQSLILSYRFARNQFKLLIKTESLQQSRNDYISTLGHELRTPLNAIFGISSMLEKQTDLPELRQRMGSIRQNAEQLTQTISELLSFSDTDPEQFIPVYESFSLEELLERQHGVVRPFLEQMPLTFQIERVPELSVVYVGDAMRIRQLLFLLSSYCLRRLKSGVLTLRVSVAVPGAVRERLRFQFAHSDLTLSPEVRQLLDDGEYANLDPKRLRYNRQMLALTTAVQLVRALGGKMIWSEHPDPYLGFELSVRPGDAPEERLSVRPINVKLRVLVVDDHPTNIKLMELMFGSLGLSIDTASGGEEALSLARAKSYHMVFMDLQMPDMDGLETTRRMLSDAFQRPIVIALTANTTESDRRRALEAGMSDFMGKPVKLADLKATILKWQSLSEFVDPD